MADVVIVGAGIIGSAVGLELAKRGVRTRILERAVPGAESSSAAAGMLAPHLEAHGPDSAGWQLGVESLKRYGPWVDEIRRLSGLEVGYLTDGGVRAIATEAELDQGMKEIAWQVARDVPVELLDRARLEAMLPGIDRRFAGGLFFGNEAQVDPRLLIRALSVATRRAGAEHLTGVTVRKIVTERGRVAGVELDDRTITADVVVLAAGAWTSLIPGVPLPKSAVEPARGQMLALDARRRPFGPFVWTSAGYLVPRTDGRVLVGATVERVGFDKSVTAGGIHGLLEAAIETFPTLRDAALIETWAGLRPYTEGDQPLIGKTDVEGLLVATGHYRNGILLAPITADMIADQVVRG